MTIENTYIESLRLGFDIKINNADKLLENENIEEKIFINLDLI